MMVSIVKVFNLVDVSEVVNGNTLKECCIKWMEKIGRCCDHINELFKQSDYCNDYIINNTDDVEAFDNAFDCWWLSLTANEMYHLLKNNCHRIDYNHREIIEKWLKGISNHEFNELYCEYLDWKEVSYDYDQSFIYDEVENDEYFDDFVDYLIADFEESNRIDDIIDALGINQ